MAGTLGSLVLKLSADAGQLTSDLGKAASSSQTYASQTAKAWQDASDKISASFSNLAAALGVGFSIDKIVQLGKSVADQAEQVENLSKAIGVSTQSLQTYSYAAALTGGSLDSVSSSLERLSKNTVLAASGNQQMAEAFRAIGISGSQLTDLLKNPDTELQVVSQHIAEFADGQTKAAVAIQLMGRGGADQIAFLDKLGSSFDEVSAQAKAFGLVLSDSDQKALVDFKESANILGEQIKGVANQFMVGLAPALTATNTAFGNLLNSGDVQTWGKDVGDTINSVIGFFNNMSLGATQIFAFLDQLWIKFSTGGQIAVAYIEFAFDSWLADVKNTLANAWDQIQNFGHNLTSGSSLGVDIDNSIAAAQGRTPLQANPISPDAGPSVDDLNKKITALWKNMQTAIGVSQDAAQASLLDASAVTALGTAHDAAGKKVLDYNAHVETSDAVLSHLAEVEISAATQLGDLSQDLQGPYAKAWDTFSKSVDVATDLIDSATAAYQAGKIGIEEYNADITIGNNLMDVAAQKYDTTTTKLDAQADIVDNLSTKLNQETELLATTGVAHQVLQAVIEAENKAREDYNSGLRTTATLTDDERSKIGLLVSSHQAMDEQIKADQEAAKQWQSIWATAGNGVADTFAKVLVEGGSLFSSLKSLAQQTVEAIISYFTKLAVINPILNSIFGGGVGGGAGFSMLPTLANSAIGSGSSSLFGGAGGVTDATSASNSSGIFSASSWIGAGKSLASGFSSIIGGTSTGGSSILGSGIGNNFMGPLAEGQSVGYTPSLFGNIVGIGGGALAAISEYKAAGGGLGGLAGGAAYGLGTLTAAGAVGGVLSGAGAAAGATGALSSVGLSAIPVVGWIALAAMALNMITKGGLFGTAYSPTGNTGLNVSTDASGIDVGATAEEKKKLPLFQGSKTKTVDIDVPQATIDALNKFFDTLNSGLTDFAKQFGVTTATVVNSSFQQTFNKAGDVTSTTESIGGQTYNDTTAQDYEERLQALSFEKVITDMGISVKGFIDNTSDADTLMQQVQDVASAVQEANTNLAGGFKFMALSADQTLPQIIAFTEGLNVSGETLEQTYARLVQAQQSYDSFVAQFKPATTYVDDFEGSMSGLYKQLLAAQAQANALAKAAGATGASVGDLTNITNSYAQQMAALTVQLEQSAQSLAFSLGITTQGSLDQVTQEINDLESKANGSTQAVSNFGSAISDTAQKATDAMNLLLGDLSPLNDQQKLQTALQGLRAGTVTADQVLEIGRRLYASSEAYNTLFKEVQGYGGKGTKATGNPYAGGSGTSSGDGLSPADQAKLQTLLAEQQTLQAAQTLSQYQTLAQQIAEIASAKQESWQDVLKEMGIQSSALEQGLGLANDDALNAYEANIQKQLDSDGDNTTSIVNAIIALPQQIAAAIYGNAINGNNGNLANRFINGDPLAGRNTPGQGITEPPGTGSNAGSPTVPTTPIGAGGTQPGGRMISDEDASAIGKSVLNGNTPLFNRISSQQRRNQRWVTA